MQNVEDVKGTHKSIGDNRTTHKFVDIMKNLEDIITTHKSVDMMHNLEYIRSANIKAT